MGWGVRWSAGGAGCVYGDAVGGDSGKGGGPPDLGGVTVVLYLCR
jgi:hypothetical protein